MTDKEFQTALDRMIKGDKEGLRQIYEAYVRLIYAVVYDTVGRREDAEDVTSDFFIKLVRVAKTFQKGSPHKAWLITIAKNMSIDFLRKSKREVLEFAQDDEGESDGKMVELQEKQRKQDGENTVENQAMLARDMQQAMSALSPKEKEIVDLKLIGQLKFKEIAEMTGNPMGTVTWLYQQAIKKLRRCLADYEQG